MFTMIKDEVKQDWQLSPHDRCDRCSAEALVKVTGISGDLLFCGHHAKEYAEKLKPVVKVIQDETAKLTAVSSDAN